MNGAFLTATAQTETSANVRHDVRMCLSPQGKGAALTREEPVCFRGVLVVPVHVGVHVLLCLLYAFYFLHKLYIIQ